MLHTKIVDGLEDKKAILLDVRIIYIYISYIKQ